MSLFPTLKLPRQFSIGSKITVGFGAILSMLCLIAVISYHATIKFQKDDGWIAHTHAVLAKLGTILSQVKGAESAVRGYALSGNTLYLDPLYKVEVKLDRELTELRVLLANNADQQPRMATMTALLAAKITFLKEVITLRDTEGLQAVQQAILTEKGQPLTDRIQQTIYEMENKEQELLGVRS